MKQNIFFKRLRNLLMRTKEISKEKGIYYIPRVGIEVVLSFWSYFYYKAFKPLRTFQFQGKTYNYFYHIYNFTWKNERAVEIPIIWEIVRKYRERKILEVGNVLSFCFPR